MGRRCLPFTFPSNVFNFARPAYCRRNKSKSLSALRDPGLFLFCAPPLAAASWARKKRRIPDAEKVVSFFSCFLRNSPLASHLVPPESLANPHFSHFLPSHPALSRISQLSCLFTNIPIISLNKVFPEAFTVSDLATLRALSSIFSIRNAPF